MRRDFGLADRPLPGLIVRPFRLDPLWFDGATDALREVLGVPVVEVPYLAKLAFVVAQDPFTGKISACRIDLE